MPDPASAISARRGRLDHVRAKSGGAGLANTAQACVGSGQHCASLCWVWPTLRKLVLGGFAPGAFEQSFDPALIDSGFIAVEGVA